MLAKHFVYSNSFKLTITSWGGSMKNILILQMGKLGTEKLINSAKVAQPVNSRAGV